MRPIAEITHATGDDAEHDEEGYGEGESGDGGRVGRCMGSSMAWAEAAEDREELRGIFKAI